MKGGASFLVAVEYVYQTDFITATPATPATRFALSPMKYHISQVPYFMF
jgi:hypothetical protein